MVKGYFIREGDKTSCGGIVQKPMNTVDMLGELVACEGDPVTCGVDGQTYAIKGGIAHIWGDYKRMAGTLDSVSGCPCQATLQHSVTNISYGDRTHAAQPPAASGASPAIPQTPKPARSPAHAHSAAPLVAAGLTDNELEEEEEEEEVEQEQLITLRLGVFFDGTGNNQSNSESVAGCMARDVGLHAQGEELQRFCADHGYGVDGTTPDDSYGNDTSNIARLYDLYVDQASIKIAEDAEEASIAVYLAGIGTVSGGADNLYGQATGRWSTGVLARVEQSPALIVTRLRDFISNNPDVKIKNIEVDVFGFSRGAAAARHFANDLQKGANSLLAKALPSQAPMLAKGFSWLSKRDIAVNFIGLFDTVAGIVSPLVGDFNPGDARVSGLELGLSANVARKVVQLVARDEYRLNFALTRTDNDIVLPGAHSDIGGGYLPRSRERLLISKPLSSFERTHTPNEQSTALSHFISRADPWLSRLSGMGVHWQTQLWSVDQRYSHDDLYPEKRVYVAARIDRQVDGDLSKVYLRVMREIALRHQVPLRIIDEHDPRLNLPAELEPIAQKLQAYALGTSMTPGLTATEESLLFRRYIHLSANWNAVKNRNSSDLEIMFINRPSDHHQRVVHDNR